MVYSRCMSIGETPTFTLRAADHPDAAALLDAYAAETERRVAGWTADQTGGAPAALAEHGFQVVVAYVGGQAVGCGGVWLLDPQTAEVKRMFIAPAARGRGIARRLLAALEAQARSLGASRVVLDTAETLTEAIALYESAGYLAIPRYNDNPYCTHWFGKELALGKAP